MNHNEDIFGNHLIELVIRVYPLSAKAFKNSSYSFEQIKRLLEAGEHNCYFQNLGEGDHKLIISLQDKGLQIEFFISWEGNTFSYKTLTKRTYKPSLKKSIRPPESDFIRETCSIKLITPKEGCRTKEELEYLYKRVSELDICTEVDIEKETEIWFKYIDATKKIIEKRQHPFKVRKCHSIKKSGEDRFNFKVDLKSEGIREYREIEEKLKALDVKDPKFNSGNISLTIKDIDALDSILQKEFKDVVVREDKIICVIKMRSLSKSQKIDLYKIEFIELNESSKILFFKFKTPEELREKIDTIGTIRGLNLIYNPATYKYKVKVNNIARKTHLELLQERIKKLGGEDFEIIVPKQNEAGDWVIPETERPKKLAIGTLSCRDSNINTLTFTLNTRDEKALNELKKLIEKKAPIEQVYPNLRGDAAKIRWLQNAVEKLTDPSNEPNGKPVNPKLKEFIFDSSKAQPIYDEDKITPDSKYWREVEQSKLSQTLNDSQVEAVLKAVHTTDLCLLQGPPGTGKTTVIAEIIWQEIRRRADNPDSFKILLTSETNLAVDNAIERLVGENTTIVKPLRFGKSDRLEEEGKKYSVDRIKQWVDKNYVVKNSYESERLEDEVAELRNENVSNNAVQHWMSNIATRAQKRAEPKYSEALKEWQQDLALPTQEIKELFQDKYFKYANVIGSTCSSCGSRGFKQGYQDLTNSENPQIRFDTVIMDEASKATPPEMALPLCFGKKTIIIGDHKQLPPMINDREFREVLIEEADAEELANQIGADYLKESQFKRLISNHEVSPTIKATFDVQYRMHSQIGNLIQQFYPKLKEGLVCGIKEDENSKDLNNKASRHHGFLHKGFIDPDTHVMWIDVPEPEAKAGTSRVNQKECETVRQVLNYLKKSDGFEAFQKHWEQEKDQDKKRQEQEIGIISFYGRQVGELTEVRKYAEKELKMKIRLKTVDKFQGMERNIVIVSTVRSDKIKDEAGKTVPNKRSGSYSPWGFADSPERLNVALSRARRLLIIVGNRKHFANFKDEAGEAIYKNVIAQIPAKNIIHYKKLNKYDSKRN